MNVKIPFYNSRFLYLQVLCATALSSACSGSGAEPPSQASTASFSQETSSPSPKNTTPSGNSASATPEPENTQADTSYSPNQGELQSPTESQPRSPSPEPNATTPKAPTATPTPTSTVDPHCDPELKLSPELAILLPLSVMNFEATGGTGDYTFELTSNNSGSIVNALSGSYIAGDTQNTYDTIRLSDGQCIGEAFAEINIVNPLVVTPSSLIILPNDAATLMVSEGSGTYTCFMESSQSGSTVDSACNYQSGQEEGLDLIGVTDDITGEQIQAQITVSFDAEITVEVPRLYLPLGGQYPLDIKGASDQYLLESSSDAITIGDTYTVLALEVGESVLHIQDAFTSATADILVTVMDTLDFENPRSGDAKSCGLALSPGDLDGDGYSDLIFGHCDGDITASNDGGISIFAGDESGLNPDPIQVLSGLELSDEAGRSLALGDLDSDGIPELIVGVIGSDLNAGDAGSVFIFKGQPDGFFEQEASLQLLGQYSGDNLGSAVAVCDFNADGYLDIAAGAYRMEDRDSDSSPSNTGGVYVYLGSESGPKDEASQVLFGSVPDEEGGWQYQDSSRIGTSMLVGDFNADSHCDLVVGGYEFDPEGQSNSGIALVYLGHAPSGDDDTGLDDLPTFAIDGRSPDNEAGQLARHMAVGDVNADGYDDLLLGQWYHSPVDGLKRSGAIRLFTGSEDFNNLRGLIDVDDADWSAFGTANYDYMGWGISIAHYDQDSYPDILVGSLRARPEGGVASGGKVSVFRGGPQLPEAVATLEYQPNDVENNGYFGEASALVDDVDGDGLAEIFALAGRADANGPDLGKLYFAKSQSSDTPEELSLVGTPARTSFGHSLDFVPDLNANGYPDLLVGAPLADPDPLTRDQGSVWTYEGDSGGLSLQSSGLFELLDDHNSSDQLGYKVQNLGDFDGDGLGDFALLSYNGTKPSTFSEAYINPEACPGADNKPGSIHIFSSGSDSMADAQPEFVYYGPNSGGQLSQIAGEFDFNGDGLQDIAVANSLWDTGGSNSGGVAIVFGRPHIDGGIHVICEADIYVSGWEASSQMGRGLSGAGDINGDGCDEVAIGGHQSDLQGLTNQGHVSIIYGVGGSGCPSELAMTTFVSSDAGSYFGQHVLGGHDFNGDSYPDLAIGSPTYYTNGLNAGSVFLISGQKISQFNTEPVSVGTPTVLYSVADIELLAMAAGEESTGYFGSAFDFVPPMSHTQAPGLLIGAPRSSRTGYATTGLAQLFTFHPTDSSDALEAKKVATFAGHSGQYNNQMGEGMSVDIIGDQVVAGIAAYLGHGEGLNMGEVFVVELGEALPETSNR